MDDEEEGEEELRFVVENIRMLNAVNARVSGDADTENVEKKEESAKNGDERGRGEGDMSYRIHLPPYFGDTLKSGSCSE